MRDLQSRTRSLRLTTKSAPISSLRHFLHFLDALTTHISSINGLEFSKKILRHWQVSHPTPSYAGFTIPHSWSPPDNEERPYFVPTGLFVFGLKISTNSWSRRDLRWQMFFRCKGYVFPFRQPRFYHYQSIIYLCWANEQ